MQLPLFSLASSWTPPDLGRLPSWAGAKRVGIDVEARDPTLKKLGPSGGRRPNNYVAGYSVAIEDGPSFYVPLRHEGGDNVDVAQGLAYLRDNAAAFAGDIGGANLPYDLDLLASDGVEFPRVRFFRDVQLADPLIWELHDRYSLEAIALRWGFEGKDEKLLREAAKHYGVDPKKDLWRLPARFVGPYGETDARRPLEVLRKQERVIEDEGLWKAYDLECRLLPVLTKMRRRGVRVSMPRLEAIEAWSLARETEALDEVFHHTSVRVPVGDVMKPEVVLPVLLSLGMKVGKTKTGKLNIDKKVLESVDHPALKALARARKVNKLRTTFAQSVRDHLTSDGRIHCIYNQLRKSKDEDDEDSDDTSGAVAGRVSCEHPNLQQQPARDDFSPMWRAIYLPEEGEQWAANDYSQQEPRMTVHYASLSRHLIGDDAWRSAIEARDRYRNDPTTDNHQMMADMTKLKRKDAKEVFLGLCYGMGGAKMCREKLHLPTRFVVRGPRGMLYDINSSEGKALRMEGAKVWEAAGEEGQAILDKFDAAVPFVRRLAKACEARAKAVGYITTIIGSKCHFPKDPQGNYDWTHKALNRLIQVSSAYQIKLAMVALDEAEINMLVQVHDEVDISVKNEQEAKDAAQIMLNCCPLELPSKVDVEMGESWGGSMGWKEAA